MQNENQQEFWQDSRTFLYYFGNDQGENDFKFSGILDQILGPYTLMKADPAMFSFWVNGIFAKQRVLLNIYGLM